MIFKEYNSYYLFNNNSTNKLKFKKIPLNNIIKLNKLEKNNKLKFKVTNNYLNHILNINKSFIYNNILFDIKHLNYINDKYFKLFYFNSFKNINKSRSYNKNLKILKS